MQVWSTLQMATLCQKTNTQPHFLVWYVYAINVTNHEVHVITVSYQTPEEFEEEYSNLLHQERYKVQNLTEFILSGSLYDATWAMALGLHKASERVLANDSSGCDHFPGKLDPLEDFEYQNKKMGCVLRKSFHQVHFLGITVSRVH